MPIDMQIGHHVSHGMRPCGPRDMRAEHCPSDGKGR